MNLRILFSASTFLGSIFICGQQKDIDTVYIFDHQLKDLKKFHVTERLKDSDIQKNSTNLSEVLRFQTPIYIKESGRGMVSSPAFRGTTAQQTALVWNGININSVFLGQGDLNNLNVLSYDEIQIKPGGGSVIYGSGAVGGTIHLNNELYFNRGLKAQIFSEYGSFQTWNTAARGGYSNDRFALKVSGSFSSSENNYEVPAKRYKNLNGDYHNTNIELGAAYRINSANTVYWQSQHFDGLQHYPVISEYEARSQYLSKSFKSLLDWRYQSSQVQNSLKLALLEDDFAFFSDINKPQSSGGSARVAIVKNDVNYLLNNSFSLNLVGEFKREQGSGYLSGISEVSRNTVSVAALTRWNPVKDLHFETGIKKDFVQGVDSPLLFSLSAKTKVFKFYSSTVNLSKNFRHPSFNDLYWQPGGNVDLKPELSYQAELINEFTAGSLKLNVTPFYIHVDNMIRWLPGKGGIWKATNTASVESFGLESQLKYQKLIAAHQHLGLSLGYAFTHSKDGGTDQFLPYVPKHKIFGSINYRYGFAEFFLQGLYNGRTFTDSEENAAVALKEYAVVNAGFTVHLLKNISLGFKTQNLFNQVYETTAYYPLPLRNYSLNFNFKI